MKLAPPLLHLPVVLPLQVKIGVVHYARNLVMSV